MLLWLGGIVLAVCNHIVLGRLASRHTCIVVVLVVLVVLVVTNVLEVAGQTICFDVC